MRGYNEAQAEGIAAIFPASNLSVYRAQFRDRIYTCPRCGGKSATFSLCALCHGSVWGYFILDNAIGRGR